MEIWLYRPDLECHAQAGKFSCSGAVTDVTSEVTTAAQLVRSSASSGFTRALSKVNTGRYLPAVEGRG